jgi:hypothetical protein
MSAMFFSLALGRRALGPVSWSKINKCRRENTSKRPACYSRVNGEFDGIDGSASAEVVAAWERENDDNIKEQM